MRDETRTTVAAGLRRIEGQVRGVSAMIEQDRYCVDVLAQMKAVRAAMHRLEALVLRDHVGGCVASAFAQPDEEARRVKLDELVETIGRMTR